MSQLEEQQSPLLLVGYSFFSLVDKSFFSCLVGKRAAKTNHFCDNELSLVQVSCYKPQVTHLMYH